MNMIQKRKIEKAKRLFTKNIEIFRCPICNENMNVNDKNSLICNHKHCFDISKKGYVNLVNKSNNKIYDKNLFESRNKIYNSGLYHVLTMELMKILDEYTLHEDENYILDAGCGEGYYLNEIYKNQKLSNKCDFIGIDISKEGINIATMKGNDIIWCISDLANLPFKDGKFDIILNILSPANYKEFTRVLNNEGIVIKVIPESDYLKEIRDEIGDQIKSSNYSNKNVIEVFKKHLNMVSEKKLNYKFNIDPLNLENLIKMTPLTSKLSNEQVDALAKADITEITIDLKILVGRYKK